MLSLRYVMLLHVTHLHFRTSSPTQRCWRAKCMCTPIYPKYWLIFVGTCHVLSNAYTTFSTLPYFWSRNSYHEIWTDLCIYMSYPSGVDWLFLHRIKLCNLAFPFTNQFCKIGVLCVGTDHPYYLHLEPILLFYGWKCPLNSLYKC